MSYGFGSFLSLLYPLGMLITVIALVALAFVLIATCLTWRRRLAVATELDRLRIERLMAAPGGSDDIEAQ